MKATRENPDRFEKATLFTEGAFGYFPMECRWIKIWTAPMAQYETATHVCFLPKGKRLPRAFATKDPVVILAGHGHPKLGGETFGPERENPATGIVSATTRYSSYDPRYRAEFFADLEAAVKAGTAKILFDSEAEGNGAETSGLDARGSERNGREAVA